MTLSAQWQEPLVSWPTRLPQRVGKTDGAADARPRMVGPTRMVQTHPLLADIVEEIADWDFADGDMARLLTTRGLPSTSPYLIAQYRVPIRTDRYFGSICYPHREYCHVVTAVGTGVVKLRPSGPLGFLIIRLRPEAAAHLIGERRAATGAIGHELRLVLLDEVFSLPTRAVDCFINVLGIAPLQ